MNKFIASTFDDLKKEEANYRKSVEIALLDYRRTMSKATTESKQYKDEVSFLNEQKTAAKQKAQTEIRLAENAFTVALSVAQKSLRDDLHQHLTTRPSAAFLDALRLYYDFDIRPSHAEIEALMTLNGGNTLGYRALNKTLEKTGAEWKVDAPDSAAYESDLAALEKLSYGNFKFTPDGLHHEMTEVYEGTPHLRLRDDGTAYDVGMKWDSVSILMANSGYKQDVEAISAMADRWSSTVLPSLKHLEAYEDNEETGETAAQQMAKDIKTTATAPEIERTNDPIIEGVRQRAQEKAAANTKATDALDRFAIK